jgi:hypothetical protein
MKSDLPILRYQVILEVQALQVTVCLCCIKDEHSLSCFLHIYRSESSLENPFGIVPVPIPFNCD